MANALHRRDFLKLGTTALATAALSPLAGLAADTPGKKRPLQKAIMYATLGYKGSVLEKFKAAKAAGFAGVEPMSHMNQDEVGKALEESGLKAASVCCNTHWQKPLSHPDEKARLKARAERKALKQAEKLAGAEAGTRKLNGAKATAKPNTKSRAKANGHASI